jgi:hypothetical protein
VGSKRPVSVGERQRVQTCCRLQRQTHPVPLLPSCHACAATRRDRAALSLIAPYFCLFACSRTWTARAHEQQKSIHANISAGWPPSLHILVNAQIEAPLAITSRAAPRSNGGPVTCTRARVESDRVLMPRGDRLPIFLTMATALVLWRSQNGLVEWSGLGPHTKDENALLVALGACGESTSNTIGTGTKTKVRWSTDEHVARVLDSGVLNLTN